MPVARSTEVQLAEFDTAVNADFMQSPDPLSTFGDEEVSLTQQSFADLSHAFAAGTHRGICHRVQPQHH